jgi:hypothetical protein
MPSDAILILGPKKCQWINQSINLDEEEELTNDDEDDDDDDDDDDVCLQYSSRTVCVTRHI